MHEAYLRLVDVEKAQHWDSRGHFFAAAAEAMRRILVENAVGRQSVKRGGRWLASNLDRDAIEPTRSRDELMALGRSTGDLEKQDPERPTLVKLRYFAGLTNREAADVMGISTTTADRYWAYARAWLKQEIDWRRRLAIAEEFLRFVREVGQIDAAISHYSLEAQSRTCSMTS